MFSLINNYIVVFGLSILISFVIDAVIIATSTLAACSNFF